MGPAAAADKASGNTTTIREEPEFPATRSPRRGEPGMTSLRLVAALPRRAARSVFYPQNHVGRGRGIRNGTMGTVCLPKILVLTIDDFVSAQTRVSASIVPCATVRTARFSRATRDRPRAEL